MSGPLTEILRTGEIGEEALGLAYHTVGRVVRRGQIPPPAGSQTWTDDAVREAAHDFMADHLLGKHRLDQLVVRAGDSEEDFEKLLYQTVRNYFHDLFRKTHRGALGRRFGELLDSDDAFRLWHPGKTRYGQGSFWGLARWESPSIYQGPLSALVPALWRIEGIERTRWREDAVRRSPVADGPSLVRFLEGALEAADGLLTVPDLVELGSHRFHLLDPPAFASLDEPVLGAWEPASTERDPGDLVVAQGRARHIYDQLSPRERQVVLRLGDDDFRTMGEALGMPKSTVFEVARRVRAIVEKNLKPDDEAASVLQELAVLAADSDG